MAEGYERVVMGGSRTIADSTIVITADCIACEARPFNTVASRGANETPLEDVLMVGELTGVPVRIASSTSTETHGPYDAPCTPDDRLCKRDDVADMFSQVGRK